MIRRITPILLLLILLAQIGVQGAIALPQYLTNLTAVYGEGSCMTCHVNATGGGTLTPYGELFANQTNYREDPSAALVEAGTPPGMNATPAVTLTPTPAVTMTPAETPMVTETPMITETPVAPAPTPRTPGFGLVISLAGLLACFVLLRRRN